MGRIKEGDKKSSGQDFSFKEFGQGDLGKKDLAGTWSRIQHAVPRLGGGWFRAFRQAVSDLESVFGAFCGRLGGVLDVFWGFLEGMGWFQAILDRKERQRNPNLDS